MQLQPLTHHEILALVEPFSRRGYHVDLQATNRQLRQIAFKAHEHPETETHPKVAETLQLWNPDQKIFSLTRTLKTELGLEASLEIKGQDPKSLVERMDAVSIARAFLMTDGVAIAQSHAMECSGSVFMDIERMTLTSAAAKVPDLDIKLRMSRVTGYHAELELASPTGAIQDLPDDFPTVLSREFGFLDKPDKTWKTRVHMPGREPLRSRRAEEKFSKLTAHVAATLAAPPAAFHETHRGARWWAAIRRIRPLIVCTILVAFAASISKYKIEPNSSLQVLIFNLPGLLLLAIFGMRELPRFERPRIPKPLKQSSWRSTPPAPTFTAPPTHNTSQSKAIG